MRFADTNIQLYAVSTVPTEWDKARQAQALLASREIAISVQVRAGVLRASHAVIAG